MNVFSGGGGGGSWMDIANAVNIGDPTAAAQGVLDGSMGLDAIINLVHPIVTAKQTTAPPPNTQSGLLPAGPSIVDLLSSVGLVPSGAGGDLLSSVGLVPSGAGGDLLGGTGGTGGSGGLLDLLGGGGAAKHKPLQTADQQMQQWMMTMLLLLSET